MSVERPVDDIRVSAARCPFCHEEVQRGVEPAVCVACHALHHTECMAEHGACAACGAEHPRFAVGERATRKALLGRRLTVPRWLGRLVGAAVSRQGMTALFVLTGLVALGCGITAVREDGRAAWVVLLAALVGALMSWAGGARRGFGAACLAGAALTPILAALSPHISTNHTSVVLGATGGLTILGATLLLIRPRRREPGPADKPKG